jgi:hypothetical protein
MDSRLRRLAENEALFRQINERRRMRAVDVWAHQHTYVFYCECPDAGCEQGLALTEDEYEHVRSQARWFLVAPGHASTEIEQVVERLAQFEIVEMRAEAARLAEQWDPRR